MFNDKFDEIFGIKKEEKPETKVELTSSSTQSVEPVPEDEFEPEPIPDPEAVPGEADPFAAALDSLLEAEGVDVRLEKRRKYDPTNGNTNSHDWATVQESMFSDEPYKFRCKRCLKWVTVGREQLLNDALQEQEVDPSCANEVIGGVQNS